MNEGLTVAGAGLAVTAYRLIAGYAGTYGAMVAVCGAVLGLNALGGGAGYLRTLAVSLTSSMKNGVRTESGVRSKSLLTGVTFGFVLAAALCSFEFSPLIPALVAAAGLILSFVIPEKGGGSMKNLIKRIAALFSAGCVLAANGLYFTVSAEDQPMIDNGYWEFKKKEKAVPDTYTSVMEHAEDRTLTVVEYSFGKVSGKSNVSADVGDGYGHDYLLAGDSTSATLTYEEPKDKYYPGDTFTSEVEIVSSGWEKRSEYLGSLWTTMICSMTVRTGSLEESEDGGDVFESETILSCVVKGTESTDLKTDSDGKSGESGTLECVIPEHYYDTMRISVSTGYQSVVSGTPAQDSFFYYYKWVPVMVPVEADTESAADDSTSESTADSADDSVWIIQDESENALESAGEDSGTEIDETIIKGKDHKPKSDGQKRSEDTAAKTAGVVGGSGPIRTPSTELC